MMWDFRGETVPQKALQKEMKAGCHTQSTSCSGNTGFATELPCGEEDKGKSQESEQGQVGQGKLDRKKVNMRVKRVQLNKTNDRTLPCWFW